MLKKIILIASMSLCLASQSEKVYDEEYKKIANCVTLSYVSPTETWGSIMDACKYLMRNGFYYIRLEFDNKYIAFSGEPKGLKAYPVRMGKPSSQESDDAHQEKNRPFIYEAQEGYLSITFPNNPNDEVFLSQLKKFSGKKYNLFIGAERDLTVECVFQAMDIVKQHIEVELILPFVKE